MFSFLLLHISSEYTYKVENKVLTIDGKGPIDSTINDVFAANLVENVIINSPIESIEDGSFVNIPAVTSLTFPASLKTIGNNCFTGLYGLQNLVLPGVLSTVGSNSFTGIGVSALTIPKDLVFGEGSFTDFPKLSGFAVEEGSAHYAVNNGVLFSKDNSKIISYPGNLQGQEFAVPSGVVEICSKCFHNNKLLSKVTFPDTLTKIGDSAFQNSKITNVDVNVETLGKNAFMGCEKLTSLSIGPKLQVISDFAFSCLRGIKTVVIPGTVKELGQFAFADCNELNTLAIVEGVEKLGFSCFSGCTSIINVNIPTSVSKYEPAIFRDCTKLAEISLTWEAIPEFAFQGCTNLVTVDISKAQTIGADAFLLCTNMKTIKLCSDLKRIERDAFIACESLTTFEIPDKCTLGDFVFFGCKSLENFTVSASNNNYVVVDGALYTKDKKEIIAFPASHISEEIIVDERVEKVHGGCFGFAKNIKNVYFGSMVKVFGNETFAWSTSLENVTYCGENVINGPIFFNSNFKGIVRVSEFYSGEKFGEALVEKTTGVCIIHQDEESKGSNVVTIALVSVAVVVIIALAVGFGIYCYKKRNNEDETQFQTVLNNV